MKKQRHTASLLIGMILLIVIFLLAAVASVLFSSRIWSRYTPVSANGALSVSDGRIVNQDGCYFDLKGISTMGIGWQSDFVNYESFRTARDEWGVNTIRLSVTTSGRYGYCRSSNRKKILQVLEKGIESASELGMYVIVDWHTLHEKNPCRYTEYAGEMFSYISEKYKDSENILYEICNEPNGTGGSWENIKRYAQQVIPLIRENAPDAIIIVGTPDFSSDLSGPLESPVCGAGNLLYAYHFYAGSSGIRGREELESALQKKLPVIVSEFSVSETDSDGSDDPALVCAGHWAALLDEYYVGKVFFSLSAENQTNAVIRSDCEKKGDWTEDDLTPAGKWMADYYTDGTGVYEKNIGVSGMEAECASTPNFTADIELDSYWSDEKNYISFYRLTLKNDGSEDIRDWKISITFDDAVELTDYWNGTYHLSDHQITITSADWNNVIEEGKTAELGFEVRGRDQSYILNMELNLS